MGTFSHRAPSWLVSNPIFDASKTVTQWLIKKLFVPNHLVINAKTEMKAILIDGSRQQYCWKILIIDPILMFYYIFFIFQRWNVKNQVIHTEKNAFRWKLKSEHSSLSLASRRIICSGWLQWVIIEGDIKLCKMESIVI